MASPHSHLDNLIALKVQYQGITRRAKMPLRDMVPHVLESRVRTFLHLSPNAEVTFERFSDSAAAYVVLDPMNASVYKQLYRAAKAKSKLKLRVSVDSQKAADPEPTPLEDLPQNTSDETQTDASQSVPSQEPLVDTSCDDDPVPAQTTLPSRPALSKSYEASDLSRAFKLAETDLSRELDSRIASLAEDLALAEKIGSLLPMPSDVPGTSSAKFAICCNSCDRTAPGVHYHCSTCEDGDFDLCQTCVDQGITCHGNDHWLIKRTNVDGQIVTSFTETIAPKPKPKPKSQEPIIKPIFKPDIPFRPAPPVEHVTEKVRVSTRTCNGCVQERPDVDFLHCRSCEDYDLCEPCFVADGHGHHPKHEFEPAVAGTDFSHLIKSKLRPGRNKVHQAICDGCDKFVCGVRHKCLDCPDWDLCGDCISNATILHPKHRFVPIYESLAETNSNVSPTFQPVHPGICCDGPHCAPATGHPTYIRGIRYKCAVCNDVDFCASCEASPWNTHNKTHPLIKFKTPVRHVSVTTTGECSDGQSMPRMGDCCAPDAKHAESSSPAPAMNAVQTVFDMKPREPAAVSPVPEEAESVAKTEEQHQQFEYSNLRATFRRDHVADGTILAPNHVFEQSWVLRNDGDVAWPAGCAAQYVGGDYMGHVDPSHPAGISELVSASKSTVCYAPLAPGQEFSFTVLLRTPPRPGKAVSFWRVTTPDGHRFGDRLWCDVSVRAVKSESLSAPAPMVVPPPCVEQPQVEPPTIPVESEQSEASSSQMIFPKLEKESPAASTHDVSVTATAVASLDAETAPATDDFEECGDEEWDGSDDGFLTDEEYDILDASDEEFLEEQQKKQPTK